MHLVGPGLYNGYMIMSRHQVRRFLGSCSHYPIMKLTDLLMKVNIMLALFNCNMDGNVVLWIHWRVTGACITQSVWSSLMEMIKSCTGHSESMYMYIFIYSLGLLEVWSIIPPRVSFHQWLWLLQPIWFCLTPVFQWTEGMLHTPCTSVINGILNMAIVDIISW